MRYKNNFSGERDGMPVAKWLNDNDGTREGNRVIALVRSLKKLLPCLSFRDWWSESVTHKKRAKDKEAELSALNRKLRNYVMFPMLVDYTSTVAMRRKGALQSRGKVFWKWSSGGQAATPIVHSIVKLGERELLSRLSECANCEAWFYARFTHQIFCSSRCREKHFRASPEWRASRRDYMRGYRQRERDRDDKTARG